MNPIRLNCSNHPNEVAGQFLYNIDTDLFECDKCHARLPPEEYKQELAKHGFVSG